MVLMTSNTGQISMYRHMRNSDIADPCFEHVKTYTALAWKQISSSLAVRDEYIILATECGLLSLLSAG